MTFVHQTGAAVVTHHDFMKKVKIVLEGDEGKFSCVYRGGNGQMRPMYAFPKREATLMAMSYSHEISAQRDSLQLDGMFDKREALDEEIFPCPGSEAVKPRLVN